MTGKIHKAVLAIMREVGPIAKDAKNKEQHYDYRSAQAIYDRVQPLFAMHGIYSVPRVTEVSRDTGKTASGKEMHITVVRVEYTFYADDGSSIVVETPGEGADFSDKATAKAMTMAHKTAITQLFALPVASVDPESGTPEWSQKAHQAQGGITLKEYNDLKVLWHETHKAEHEGQNRQELAAAFDEFAKDHTELIEQDVRNWRQWRREEYEACVNELKGGSE